MSTTKHSHYFFGFVLTLSFVLLSLVLNMTLPGLVLAQDSTAGERKLLKAIPSRVPITVVAVRNLQNEHWLRDLEIEIRNDSTKPIYYLDMTLRFPDIPKSTELDGIERGIVIPLTYGRWELAKRTNRPTGEDVPIKPGETYIFKVAEPHWEGFEHYLARKGIPESATKRLQLSANRLMFDDGTGFSGGGSPLPGKWDPQL